jgi:phosphatidate cytidylyltransferase
VIAPDPRHNAAAGPAAVSQSKARNLSLRIASSLVLAPLTVLCAYVGGWLFFVICAIAAGTVLWEWTKLVADSADPWILAPGWAALLAALLLTGWGETQAAVVVIAASAIVAGGAGVIARHPSEKSGGAGSIWAAGGVIYAGAAFCGPALLRRDPEWGFTALLFLFATVWATDIFAFFAGRAIGGPTLWRSVSPNKTWAGAVGGLIGGLAAGVSVAYASGSGKLAMAGVMGLVLSVLAQAGDLFESAVKRHFGAKDASQLIPGHGGLMDRLDGFLVAAVAALVIGILHQGMDAPARGFLLW